MRALSPHVLLIAGAALVATTALASAESPYPVNNMPDISTACRASDPPQCLVPATEEWQAKYRERCAEAPERCTYRPDGTISSWSGKFTGGARIEQVARQAREQLRATQMRAGEVGR